MSEEKSEDKKLRIECIKIAASLLSPNCSLESVLPCAKTLWKWVDDQPEYPETSKTKSSVKRSLERLNASQVTLTSNS